MRYTPTSILFLVGLSNALPLEPRALPAPTVGGGSGFGSGLGSGLSLPFSLPSMPTATRGAGSGLGSGLGSGSGSGMSLPFSLPSMPTGGAGSGLGSGLGSGFSLPFSLPAGSIPTGGASIPGGDSDSGSGGLPDTTVAAPSSTVAASATSGVVVAPTATGAAGGGTVGSNCTPQNSGSSTENGIKDKNCCTDVTVIFARGTGEMGNMGSVSGPPMVKALRQKLGAGKVTVQGVDYPADSAGNANLGASGGPTMASLVKTSKSQCPSSKIILSGYSQGAMVVHNAFKQGVSGSDVAGAVLFGDPLKSQAVGDLGASKTKEFCASADTICGGGNDLQGSHISYGSVGGEAADWIVGVVGKA